MSWSASLVGTVRGADRCGDCRHTRLRHADHGKGACQDLVRRRYIVTGPPERTASFGCTCPRFTEPKGS